MRKQSSNGDRSNISSYLQLSGIVWYLLWNNICQKMTKNHLRKCWLVEIFRF
ncbi:unnamed protein product [Onchocerca flexuosa]|uniref:Uncharacterized protein n=1 Tax=Onchocerca flexuosa TaxID=387005 RepID=A0A183I8L5_9BILA|nr:unnamed protein product [Onchocerca flexuosa]